MTRTRLHFHYSLYQWWGVPSRYVQLVDHLDPARFACSTTGTPDVVDPDSMPDWQRQTAALIAPDMRRQHAPWHNLNDLASEAATARLCADGKVEIVHFLDGEHSGPWLPRLFRNRLRRVKSVATFHQPPSLAEEVTYGPALRLLDAIILMSPSQLPFFSRFVPPDRLHVILHGIDITFFSPPATPRRSDRLHCITTGLHLRDWEAFHAVAKALPDVDFTVVTSGRVTLQSLPNVKVLSGISDAALAAAYRAADVLFLPLKDATANNSILEGMASGLPIVSTELEAVRAYVPDTAGVLIKGNAVQALAAALSRLADDQAMRDRMGAAARQQAEALSWSHVVRQYEAVYAGLLPARLAAASDPAEPLPALRSAAPAEMPRLARKIWSAAPDDAFAPLAEWAEALRDLGLTGEAGMIVDGLVAAQPGSPATWAALAAQAEAEWRWQDAAGHWGRYLRACTDNASGDGQARMANAQAQAGALAAARQTLEAGVGGGAARLSAARIASQFGDAEQALAAWQVCTAQHPDQIGGFLGLARHHLHQADFDRADALLDHTRQVWPESAEAAALWAHSADEKGDMAGASRRWAVILARHGQIKPVLFAFAHHLGLTADLAACKTLLASCDLDQGMQTEILLRFHNAAGDWGQAADQARRAVRRLPEDLARRQRCADLLLRLGTPPALREALEILRGLRQHAPEATVLLPSLARALIAAGVDQEACAVIETLSADRRDRQAVQLRQWARLRAEGNDPALRSWRTLVLDFDLAGSGCP